jgi:hypothetical protein
MPEATGSMTIADGYVQVGTLHGPAVTFVASESGTTKSCVVPACDNGPCTPSFGATALCAAGVLVADTQVSVAGLGFALNAPQGAGEVGTVPAPRSVTINFTLGGGAGDSAQLELEDSQGKSYCLMPGEWESGIPIDISLFNTTCWDRLATNAKALTAGTPISFLLVAVPSVLQSDSSFSVCMTNVSFTYNALDH